MLFHRRIVRALAIVLISGCATRDDLGQVRGRITLDGTPLSGASIEFTPTGRGSTAYGRSDDQGEYSIMFTQNVSGASIGENLVRISTYDISDDQGYLVPLVEKVPARYNVNSDVLVAVELGGNEFNFDLQSAGEIVQPIMGGDVRSEDLATVRGTISLDGLPLTSATVTLSAFGDNTNPAVGHTDEQGEYCVIYCCDIEGALVGKTTARISFPNPEGEPFEVVSDFSVEPGINRFDVQLESQSGQIIAHLQNGSQTPSDAENPTHPVRPVTQD